MPLKERGQDSLLSRGVDHPRYIGWCDGGGGVDGVGHQDSGVAPAEDVGISAGKIVSIAGFSWWVGTVGGKK